MYSFLNFEPVCCSMFSSNCCFLTCMQVLQEVGKVVLKFSLRIFYSLLWSKRSNALAYSMKQQKMFFCDCLAFSMIQGVLAIWSLVLLPFLNPAYTSGSSRFKYFWSLAWRILSITFLACEMSAIVAVVWAFFGFAFLWDWNENWPFPVLWPLLSFPNLLAYWVQHFHSIIFQDLK